MDNYIGCKMIQAEPMNLGDYNKYKGWTIPKNENPLKEGYIVKYNDNYVSWSPKDIFESSYLKISPNKNLKTNVSISQDMVDDFIKEVHAETIADKTTLVRVILANGFELVEASSCVDKENYSEEIGKEVCLNKIKDKIWFLLGFLLQTGVNGVKK